MNRLYLAERIVQLALIGVMIYAMRNAVLVFGWGSEDVEFHSAAAASLLMSTIMGGIILLFLWFLLSERNTVTHRKAFLLMALFLIIAIVFGIWITNGSFSGVIR